MSDAVVEVARYRITLTTTEDEYRSVLTCKDCPTAPVLFHPGLEVRDPPISTIGSRRSPGSRIGVERLVPAAFRHEMSVHAPGGIVRQPRGQEMTMLASPDGLRFMAQLLDGLAALTKGEIGVRMANVTVNGGFVGNNAATPGSD